MNDDTITVIKGKVETDEYFGGCPHCGGNNGFLNVGREALVGPTRTAFTS